MGAASTQKEVIWVKSCMGGQVWGSRWQVGRIFFEVRPFQGSHGAVLSDPVSPWPRVGGVRCGWKGKCNAPSVATAGVGQRAPQHLGLSSASIHDVLTGRLLNLWCGKTFGGGVSDESRLSNHEGKEWRGRFIAKECGLPEGKDEERSSWRWTSWAWVIRQRTPWKEWWWHEQSG